MTANDVDLAPGFPRRAAELVRTGLGRCAGLGLPGPPARLWLETVEPGALGTAYARCHEAAVDTHGRPAIRIQIVGAALARRDRSRLRVPIGLHALWHEYAHALDQELRAVPDDDGVCGRFGRHTRRQEWRDLFAAYQARRLPYLSAPARRGVDEFFAEAFVAYVGRPALLRGPGEPLIGVLEETLLGTDGPSVDRPGAGAHLEYPRSRVGLVRFRSSPRRADSTVSMRAGTPPAVVE